MSRANVRPEDLPRMLSAVKRRCQVLAGDEEEMITYGSRIVPANLPESAFNWLRSRRVRDIPSAGDGPAGIQMLVCKQSSSQAGSSRVSVLEPGCGHIPQPPVYRPGFAFVP